MAAPSRSKREKNAKSPPENEPENWDEVAEASWESFPASDPSASIMRRPMEPEDKPRTDKPQR